MSFYDRLLSATAPPLPQCSFHGYCCVQLIVTMMRKVDQTVAMADTLEVEALVVARGLLCRPSFSVFCNAVKKEEEFAQPFIDWSSRIEKILYPVIDDTFAI